ncbi:hypothetical protein HK104_000708 [Borealophlyctis nickersoniae]|nr:hypothetical protein HK104_000708 [Borealophlyctis nickersoniae]
MASAAAPVSSTASISTQTSPPRTSSQAAQQQRSAPAPAPATSPASPTSATAPPGESTPASTQPTNPPHSAYSIAQIFQFRKWKLLDTDVIPKLNESHPLSLFYHADEYLLRSVASLKKVTSPTSAKFRRLNDRVHRAQRLLLDSIYLCYVDLSEEDKSGRAYRAQLPPEDQRELEGGFSENIWFAGQALSRGFRIRGIEAFTAELVEPAKQLCATMEALRFVFRCRALVCTAPPHTDLFPVLADFDKSWTAFEHRICFCYFSVTYSGRPGRADETDMFLVLLSETLLRAISKNYLTWDQIHSFDPSAIIALPRLTIISGLLHMPDCVSMTDAESGFRYFRGDKATKLRGVQDELRSLKPSEVEKLEWMIVGKEEYWVPTEGVEGAAALNGERWDSGMCLIDDNEGGSIGKDQKAAGEEVGLQRIFRAICAVADDLQSGPRAREFVGIMHKVFSMHEEKDVEKTNGRKAKGKRRR